MSWDRSWPKSAPKKPPPKHGIKMKKAGTTWWGQRWIEALEQVLRGDAGRLARGRTYARAGRTHDLKVEGGVVSAAVTGSRATPYQITIRLRQLTDAAWEQAVAGMAAKAQFSAELLAGQMPKAIDEVFHAAGISLFPKQRADLETDCSCPDWGDPCKHVAATHYVLGEALDRDPFLLFELRGRTKAWVLDALRRARGGASEALGPAATKPVDAPEIPKLALGRIDAADYDRARDPLPSLHFSFEAPVTSGALLRQLGAPSVWNAEGSPADDLAAQIHAAAETARRIALAEPERAIANEDEPALDPPRSQQRTPSSRSKLDRPNAPARSARRAAPKAERGRSARDKRR
jgi:uncharacterized Zn finger protein